MGRAIVREPAAFLFDEPLSNLDAKLRVQMRLEIKRLQRSLGTTSVYVTHDQVEAMTMADRLVVMNEGRAEQVGTPMEVYERPASLFVAGFIGSPAMNFLEAKIEGGKLFVNGASGLTMPVEVADGSVTAGIRPEHLAVANGDSAAFELTVQAVEPLGADTLIHGALEDGQSLTVRLSGTPPFREGGRVHLGLAAENLHLFHSDSGRRLA